MARPTLLNPEVHSCLDLGFRTEYEFIKKEEEWLHVHACLNRLRFSLDLGLFRSIDSFKRENGPYKNPTGL